MSDLLNKESSCWNSIGVWGDNSCEELRKLYHCRNCNIFINSGKQLFEKDTPDGYKKEWTEILSKEKISEEKADNSCLVFRIGKEWFAFDSIVIEEVTDDSIIHSLPHQNSKYLLGIVNVRGEIKLAIDLKLFLKPDEISDDEQTKNVKVFKRHIVIKKGKDNWVFPVDEIIGIWKFNEKNINHLPSTAKNDANNNIKGFIKFNNIEASIIVSEKLFATINKKVF